MSQLVLVSDDGVTQVYTVLDDNGVQIGTDVVHIPTVSDINLAALQSKAQAAIAANVTFLGLASPTTPQAVAQVQLLTRECSALIRLLLGLLDSTTGT